MADDDIRNGLRAISDGAEGFSCSGDSPDAETALREIPDKLPDVILMDIALPGISGIECVRQLNRAGAGIFIFASWALALMSVFPILELEAQQFVKVADQNNPIVASCR